jgi:hypothetical protein
VVHVALSILVMPGLVPGIHVFLSAAKTWMAGTSPAMTALLKIQIPIAPPSA